MKKRQRKAKTTTTVLLKMTRSFERWTQNKERDIEDR